MEVKDWIDPDRIIQNVKNGIKPDKDDLYAAIMADRVDVVKFLIDEGMNTREGGDRALRMAVATASNEMIKLLIENGSNIRVHSDSCVRWSFEKGLTDRVEFLLENGARLRGVDPDRLSDMISSYNNGEENIPELVKLASSIGGKDMDNHISAFNMGAIVKELEKIRDFITGHSAKEDMKN